MKGNLRGRNKTFVAVKQHTKPTARKLKASMRVILGIGGDLRESVRLPDGEDLNEWLAVNVCDFFNEVSLIYGTIFEFCTEKTCPIMGAGAHFEYWWADNDKYQKAVQVSAPKYADLLMTWVQQQLNDQNIFPVEENKPFPKNFKKQYVDTILRRLFRIYAHIYHAHLPKVKYLGMEAHLNFCFKHFIYFCEEFNCIRREELAPLADIIASLKSKDNPTENIAFLADEES